MTKNLPRLSFNKNIISSVNDTLSSNELLARLGTLHDELSLFEQGQLAIDSLSRYKSDLISKKLLKSKDPGVQAFVACCLSDLLRLYAPDAPYTDAELCEIFKLFINQFKMLSDAENGYYVQQTYLITRLLEFRSIVLVTDLSSSPKLIEDIFAVFYDKEHNSFQPKLTKIIGCLLGEILSECESVPMSVLRNIFNKFLTHDLGDKLNPLKSTIKDPAFEFSLTICQSYSNRLGRHFTKFYSEILYGITNSEQNRETGQSGVIQSTLDAGFKTLTKLHKLTANIWQHVPELLSSVVGFVYQELCSDNIPLRIGATRLVANILAIPSEVNFVTQYNDTYKAWLLKIADINSTVRSEWVNGIPDIINARTDISEDICKGIIKTLLDVNETVRLNTVEIFQDMPIKNFWNFIKDATIYTELLQLTREKNKNIRENCIKVVARIYTESVDEIERNRENEELWEVVDKTPCVLFNLYYINDPNITFQTDTVIFEKLFPLQPNDGLRVKRLLLLLSHFDQKAFSSFFAYNKRQVQMSNVLNKFIELCEVINSPDSNEESKLKLNKTIDWFVATLPTQIDCKAIFEKFLELNDKRIHHLIKTCIKRDVNYSTMKNSMVELITRLKDEELFKKRNVKIGSSFTRDTFQSVFKILIYRSAPLIYNVSTVPLLLDNNRNSTTLDLKRKLVEHISEVNPTIFRDQLVSLKEIVKRLDDTDILPGETMTVSEALKTIYKISISLTDIVDMDDEFFITRLKELAVDGTPDEAKYALKLISLTSNKTEILTSIKKQILPLAIEDCKNFPSHILVLAEIFKIDPHVLDDDSTDIVSYLIRHTLLANQVVGDSQSDGVWINDTQLNDPVYYPLASKLYSLKLFTNKLRSISNEVADDEIAQTFTEKTMKLFFYMLANGGELIAESNNENYPTPNNYQTKLRYYAGIQVLKVAKVPNFNSFILPKDIMKLVNLVEDECLEVRRAFLDKLRHYIGNEYISIKFLPLVFFMAYEPDTQLKQDIKTWINFTINKTGFQKGTIFERALPRLIHCIANHPDVIEGIKESGDTFLNSITTAIDYLVFYFDSVASSRNICLLYYLAGRVKQYQDSTINEEADTNDGAQSSPKNIYIISELTQLILSELKNQRGWNLPVYPGKLNLPSDLYQPFPSMDEAQRNTFVSYLPDDQIDSLVANIKGKLSRLSHNSSTRKQITQKKKLTSEYQNSRPSSSNKPKRRKIKDNDADGDDSDTSDAYVPKLRNENANIRKSTRSRKTVNYVEDDENENGD
ncbi:HGL070Wp [Eremothecium sinecaudum]|uniref:HGL070Wp n=1 Tax=Eremothecium sinecaudum TaxID=45286 RepID=A0A0X8HVJ7_9SACH|nr:HGL070Wp [Eremothecium sinecaudum]AMD22270.1 HGL070Wp [Eremothecium sinecaudum]